MIELAPVMGLEGPGEITALLSAWSGGDRAALERLTVLVEGELRRIAHIQLQREDRAYTLNTADLVNEAWLRLIGGKSVGWQDRTHFLAVWAQVVRRILVDRARARRSAKRGAGLPALRAMDLPLAAAEPAADLVAVDDALEALAKTDNRKARVVELRFFGGLSVAETAELLNVSQETVQRDWRLARAWLLRELTRQKSDGCRRLAAY